MKVANELARSLGFSRFEPPEGGTPYQQLRFTVPILVPSLEVSPANPPTHAPLPRREFTAITESKAPLLGGVGGGFQLPLHLHIGKRLFVLHLIDLPEIANQK